MIETSVASKEKRKSTLHFRLEVEEDYRMVEELTREAFWNNFQEGCDEHFLLYKLRSHVDYLPNLSYLAILKDSNMSRCVECKTNIIKMLNISTVPNSEI